MTLYCVFLQNRSARGLLWSGLPAPGIDPAPLFCRSLSGGFALEHAHKHDRDCMQNVNCVCVCVSFTMMSLTGFKIRISLSENKIRIDAQTKPWVNVNHQWKIKCRGFIVRNKVLGEQGVKAGNNGRKTMEETEKGSGQNRARFSDWMEQSWRISFTSFQK